MAMLSEFFSSLPRGESTRFEPESFRAVGSDRVLVFIRAHGTGVGSGIEVETQGAHLTTLRSGRVVRTESYTDRGKALAAAGLSEWARSRRSGCGSATMRPVRAGLSGLDADRWDRRHAEEDTRRKR